MQARLIKLEKQKRKGKQPFWYFNFIFNNKFKLKWYLYYFFPEYKSTSTQAVAPKEPKVDKGESWASVVI